MSVRTELHVQEGQLSFLLLSRERPNRSVFRRRVDPSEEVLQPLVLVVGITVEVEEAEATACAKEVEKLRSELAELGTEFRKAAAAD